nr:hypothetical protein [Tanacetum cinerariifolium]
MNPIATPQAALDNALFPHEKRLKIERCNAKIAFSKPQKEETYQVTLEDLKLSLCYPAFQITAEVPEIYIHQFWNTIKKIGKTDGYNFKLDTKKCRVKRPAKKATTALTTGVVIRDTPVNSGDSEDESNDVHDEDDNDDDNDNDDEDGNADDSGNDDGGGNNAQDSERTNSDDDENPSFTLKDYEEEQQNKEYVLTPKKDKSDNEDNMYEEEDDDVAKELEEAQAVNQEFLNQVDSTMKARIKEQVKAQVSKIMPQIKKKSSKDAGPSKGLKLKESRTSGSSKGTETHHQSSGKSTQTEEPIFETADTDMQYDQGNELGHLDDQLDDETSLRNDCFVELEYYFEECYQAVNDRLDWHNPEGREYPFDLSKPLPLIKDRGRQVVLADYFINNDLGYLRGGNSSCKYTTSTTRTKAT